MVEEIALDFSTLTDIQQRILIAIVQFKGDHGYPPSYSELGEMVGCSKYWAHWNCKELKDLGWLTVQEGKSRTLVLTPTAAEHMPAGTYQRGRELE